MADQTPTITTDQLEVFTFEVRVAKHLLEGDEPADWVASAIANEWKNEVKHQIEERIRRDYRN